MLKQLRCKFTLITLALATLVLLVVLVFNTVTSYQAEKREIYRSLDRVSEIADKNTDEPPAEFPPQEGEGEFSQEPPPGGGEPDRDLPRMGRDELPGIYAFSVLCDADGNVVRTFAMNADMSEDDLAEAVKTALAAKNDDGTLRSLGLIYRRYGRRDGSVQIAFSSYASLSRSLKQNILISLIVFAVGAALLFLVSLFLSGLALRPVAEAWEGQKRFVADVSHDLRTPLTVILANNNILRTHPDESVARQMKWIDATDEEAERMKALTEKMLELSRSETVGAGIELAPVDLSDLVGETAMRFEPVAFEAGVSLDAKIDPDIVVRSDRDAFSRIAHILIDNAVKYAERGSTVEVSLTRKKQIVFSVRNRGEVIPESDLPHLFDRFYRADRVRSVGGHGLGLSIAKNLTAAIKGKITVSSSEENGTEFSVILPDKA
ncbi:MAG: HAMP domain-containing histidine kinase [Clostridia bacterium]|nr:HAMP domain-containing histidine kinase [Clostridia bacterium]